ncbi:MAG: ShlB/FhaC/HecB family hemolysin secretion/activation protein [Prochlorothrix sp.]
MPLVLERDVVAEGSVTVNRTGSDLSPGANVPTESVPGPLLALVGWADPGVSRSALAPIDRSTTPQTWIPGVTLPIANPGTTARVVDPADGDEGLSWVAASQGLDLPAPQLEPIDVGTVGVQGRRPIAQPDQTDPLGQVSPVVQVSQVAPTLPDSREVNPPDPNTDRFPQPLPDLTPDRDDRPVLDETPEPSQNLPATGSGITVDITRLEVVGSTTYSAETLAEITAPFENRALTLEELQSIADQITQLYLNEGYTTSRAVLVDQEIIDGVVQIQVIEGILAEVIIEGTERLSRDYIEDRIRLGAKVPLRTDQLEDQLRMLRVDPLIGNIETSLRASEKVGQSVLGVRIVEAPNIVGSIGSDNYSPESVGGQRTRAAVTYNNIMGNGESITGTWDRSYIGGSDVFRLTYKMPVNARNGTLQFQSTTDRNEITQKPFDAFDIAGKTDRYDFTYRQPIIRNPRQELALSIGYAYQTSRTFVLNTPTRIGTTTGAETDGVTRTSIIKFSQDFVRRDASGAWAFQSQFSFGTDWFGATTQDDDIPDSQFFSWLSQGQRVQRLNNDHLLIIQGNLQFASGPMLGSQQFVIGGGQSVRGYRQNTRAADSGWRFSIEDRWTVRRNETGRSLLQLAPFFDAGLVWNHRKNPNALSTDSRFLAGAGLGLLWQPTPKINVRVDYGIPLVGVEDNGNDALQSRGLYFTVGYNFAR